MKAITSTKQFKKDQKRATKRGKDLGKLRTVILLLVEDKPLAVAYRDHALKGTLAPARELHIEPDWLLVYESTESTIHLIMHGTHSDLFNE